MSVLKSEKLRPVLSTTGGSPAIKGFMPSIGVQLGRDGIDDPLAALPEDYSTPIPNANQAFFSAWTNDSVLALPSPACRSIHGVPRANFPQYRKPRRPKS